MDGGGSNFGDIWISEAAAQIVCGVEHALRGEDRHHENSPWNDRVHERSVWRRRDQTTTTFCGEWGHPWLIEIREAFETYQCIQDEEHHIVAWLEKFKCRTIFWCAQILAGVGPFPPKPNLCIDDEQVLIERLNRFV